MKMPELLSPVGGKQHLTAAVNAGADAVYMGGLAFNARIFADNFRDEELEEAVNYAHLHGTKVYITINILLKDRELPRALEYVNFLYSIGVDGLIVDDMGIIRLIHKYLPDFPIHLSTQATLYNREAIALAEEMGCCRVVPARELSIEEINEVTQEAKAHDMETEIFIHGAMCMCYSGQCQMSRMIGRKRTGKGKISAAEVTMNEANKGSCRSGNRGTCAQPCRQAYTDDKGQTYYALSPKDMCQIENLPELIMSGASSFKIEGRIKTPEYVATVTSIYRKYIDLFDRLEREYGAEEASRRYEVEEEDLLKLRQIFNRGNFSEGYLHGNPGDDILSGLSPKNQGIYAGQVVAVLDNESKAGTTEERRAVRGALKRGKVLVCIAINHNSEITKTSGIAGINPGDGLEFRAIDEWTPRKETVDGVTTFVKYIGGGQFILGDFDRGVEVGDSVFKVTDKQLNDEALDIPEKKLPLTMVFTAREGTYPTLAATDVRAGNSVEITADHIVERARKAATEADRIEDNLSRLGGTPYELGLTGIDVQIDDDIMMPVSIINRMRRDAVDQLIEDRTEAVIKGRKPLGRDDLDEIIKSEGLGIDVLDEDAFRERLAESGIRAVPLEDFIRKHNASNSPNVSDSTGESGASVVPYILNISKGNLDEFIRDNFDEIVDAVKDTGILIGNLGWIKQFRDAGIKVYGDYGLNVYNEQARRAYEEAGVEVVMLSHETGIMDERGIPLMITEHPVNSAILKDRKGEIHRIVKSASGDKTLIY